MNRVAKSSLLSLVVTSLVALTFTALPFAATPAGAATLVFGTSQVFQETGSSVTSFQTPINTCGLLVDALGGSGGAGYTGPDSFSNNDNGGPGGAGGYLSEIVPVGGAVTLSVNVGAGGGNGTSGVAGAAGYGGGGTGGSTGGSSQAGGGGGGESTVAIQGGATLAVAGGGGGGDSDWLVTYNSETGGAGGAGANTPGSDGANSTGPFGGDYSPGMGGTLTAGGAGSVGVNGQNGSAGSANQGGNGASGNIAAVGGGGGSGYFGGGGGGERSGGGGGSSFAISASVASNVAPWTPAPTTPGNGEVVITAEQCQSTSFGAAPTSPTYGGSYSPTSSSTSGLTDVVTIDPSASSVCSISGGVVSFNAVGTCVVDADQGGNASWGPAGQVQQSFPITRATPSTPTISNIPGATVGSNFMPVVATNGDGTKSVTSNTTNACTVSAGVVTFIAVATCSLTAHVATGTNYGAADGSAQTFSIKMAPPQLVVVVFNSEGGSTVPYIVGLNGSMVALPAAPVLAGYTFNGWFSAPAGGTALTSPYALPGTLTLYAQWTPLVKSAPTKPLAPTITAISRSQGTITVTIVGTTGDGGSAINGYECLIGGTWRHVAFNGAHQLTLRGLTSRGHYAVAVRARNAMGWGDASNRVFVVVRPIKR